MGIYGRANKSTELMVPPINLLCGIQVLDFLKCQKVHIILSLHSKPSCPARLRTFPFFFCHWPPSAQSAHLRRVWPAAGRLIWTLLKQWAPLTRATRPLFEPLPLTVCPATLSSLAYSSYFLPHHGSERNLERRHVVLCLLLGYAAGGWLPMVHQSSHLLSFPPFDLLLGTDHCLITLGEKERDQWCFWHSPLAFDGLCAADRFALHQQVASFDFLLFSFRPAIVKSFD